MKTLFSLLGAAQGTSTLPGIGVDAASGATAGTALDPSLAAPGSTARATTCTGVRAGDDQPVRAPDADGANEAEPR